MSFFVFIKHRTLLLHSIFITVLLIIYTSCAGYGDIAKEIESNSEIIQSGNVGILHSISEKNLRTANDSQYGTLYYAGLLWYFQDDRQKAVIAFKRSARTSADPWNKESARLVGSIYSSTFEYGPLFDFYESLNSLDFFASDSELFYYYAMSMWSLREYDVLAQLVQKAQGATWKRTPRNRVTVLEARFALQFWKYLLDSFNNKQDSITSIETLLLESSAYSLMHSIPFFLERVPDTISIPDEVYQLIKAKVLLLDDTNAALEAYFSLPITYLLHQKTLSEVLSLARKSKQGLQQLHRYLLRALNNTDITEQYTMYVLAYLAYVRYLQGEYDTSARYYERLFSSLPEHADTIVHNNVTLYVLSFRTFLYITIKREPHRFVDRYLQFSSLTLRPELFAATLEEYLYEMLRQHKYDQLERDLKRLSNVFREPAIQLELSHWRSMLRIAEKDVPTVSVPDSDIYKNIFTYDFFLTPESEDIDADVFFETWFANSEEEHEDALQPSDTQTIDLLVEGYIKFGLFDYAHSVMLANISLVSFEKIKQVYAVMERNNEYYKAYVLANKAAYFTPHVFSHVEDVRLIYPQAYKDIIHSLTENTVERSLLFGLMREESSYSPTIRSSANAVGLTQLLFATAEDIATRIDYGSFSLVNPQDNLTLGYEYFMYLIRVLKNPMKAILAYNGGIGNVWKWEKAFDTSNLFLFSARVPFRETRRYVRKVLSSAMIYGILYYDVDPKDIIAYVSTVRK